jgi:CDGSH-type Zn-finger protein
MESGIPTPLVTTLEPGTYYWCRCRKSENRPFCDGAHGEGVEGPMEFVLSEKKEVALCTCGKTKSPPYCDGSHEIGG